jgi:hypothetical protein
MKKTEINSRIEQLMWLEIDETISPRDRENLYVYLETHPDARVHFDEIRRMALLFGQEREVDPPPELRGRIHRALENATPPVARRPGLLERLGAFFAPRPAWRLATAAAAGVFVGIAGYHLFLRGAAIPGTGDVSPFYGAMSLNGLENDGAALRIDVSGVRGTFVVRRDRSHVYSRLDVASEREIEVVLVYKGSPLTFTASESFDPRNRVSMGAGEVRVRHRGEGAYRFLFAIDDNAASPVTVSVLSEGSVVYEAEVFPESEDPKR